MFGGKVSLFLLVATAASTTVARAQGPYCRPFDKTGYHILYTVDRAATMSSDSVYRAKIWRIPLLAPSDVVFVTDETICERAARAFDRYGTPETSTLKRGVYVVRLGTSYLVVDSESRGRMDTRLRGGQQLRQAVRVHRSVASPGAQSPQRM